MPRYRFDSNDVAYSRKAFSSPPALADRADPYQTTLERDFQRVLIAIQAMWGYPELNAYFHKLTMCDRRGREGFPPDVWEDIHLLWSLHQTLVPDSLH